MHLIGQENNLEMINRWKELPNFIIIQGEEHSGKKYLTLYLCKKFGLRYVNTKNSIASIRSLLQQMGENTNQLFHFDDFHTASIQAKNALLKITEEPFKGNYIVITGSAQIKTLESRARKIIMQPYTLKQISEYIGDKYNDDMKKVLYEGGINTPAKVAYYSKYENLEGLIAYTNDIFQKITYLNEVDCISMLSRFQDRYEPGTIDACLLFLMMLIKIIETHIEKTHYYSYQPILEILVSGKNALIAEPTLRRKMLLFRMFNKIMQLSVGVNGQ